MHKKKREKMIQRAQIEQSFALLLCSSTIGFDNAESEYYRIYFLLSVSDSPRQSEFFCLV